MLETLNYLVKNTLLNSGMENWSRIASAGEGEAQNAHIQKVRRLSNTERDRSGVPKLLSTRISELKRGTAFKYQI